MGSRTARHQRPGQKNLRGRKTGSFCPCCDEVINHREKILAELARREMRNRDLLKQDDMLMAPETREPMLQDEALRSALQTSEG